MINRLLKVLCGVAIAAGLSFFTVAVSAKPANLPSAGGKYINLIQEIRCPADAARYGEFNDYGYWQGGPWCGQLGKNGYWVWVKPKWYVWEKMLGK